MKTFASVITVAAAGVAVLSPAAAATASTPRCAPVRPTTDFYAGGRVASAPIASRCTTVSVSGVRDAARPSDTCQTFLLALLSADGRDPTYTEPVRVCSRGVVATGVPAGSRFRVLYEVDYIDPSPQSVRYMVWR
ncbi:hypothetical protein Aab01nite_61720 [Paractinoplanes abujensis]|uniref:Secreted protein n=1 Tax=Paractinoplanes abujensis TaxID=882441 RepID=A0A7W7G0A8_9ACTN|nr:hypothetical protein [Actinoplanes abujensis]MBB4692918.1 hypothetical protein [Actinoplanes abujensis]GID22582.1 hypothetical protein Aab01nite_61720 [Actinoplanes abujensis]